MIPKLQWRVFWKIRNARRSVFSNKWIVKRYIRRQTAHIDIRWGSIQTNNWNLLVSRNGLKSYKKAPNSQTNAPNGKILEEMIGRHFFLCNRSLQIGVIKSMVGGILTLPLGVCFVLFNRSLRIDVIKSTVGKILIQMIGFIFFVFNPSLLIKL